MIKESVRIHGGESFEIDLGYLYDKTEKKSTYDIDTYIFIPRSLDINEETYTKSHFYEDLKTNIRFITPVYTLREISFGEKSAFQMLNESLDKHIEKNKKKSAKHFRYHIKMFSSIFRSSLSRNIMQILSVSDSDKKNSELDNLLINLPLLVKQYRSLKQKVDNSTLAEREKNAYYFGDEYMSYNIVNKLLVLIAKLSKKNEFKASVKLTKLRELLEKELQYQRENSYLIVSTNKKKSNQEYVYRKGTLRKFADDRLFLSTRTRKEGKLIEQIIFSLAAGIAMIFATGVAFVSQQYYGNFTMSFFIALVISYMAKDRIKELVRNTVNSSIQNKYFYDNRTNIISGDEKIGFSRENIRFIPWDNIPKNVKTKRNIEHLTEIENDWKGEDIMHYKKRVSISNKRFRKVLKEYDIIGIKDIIRLNVSRMTAKMSTPYITYNGWDAKYKKVKQVKATKVYRINLVMVFKHKDKTLLTRYRVFLNKKGIKKIERIS